MTEKQGQPFEELEPIQGTKVTPAVGIAAIALNMAMKYHDIATVQDGELYQQYKLEGRNMVPLHLDMVFETAMKMEAYLLGASDRIAKFVVEALADVVNDEETADKAAPATSADKDPT